MKLGTLYIYCNMYRIWLASSKFSVDVKPKIMNWKCDHFSVTIPAIAVFSDNRFELVFFKFCTILCFLLLSLRSTFFFHHLIINRLISLFQHNAAKMKMPYVWWVSPQLYSNLKRFKLISFSWFWPSLMFFMENFEFSLRSNLIMVSQSLL